jgi:Mg-chelatase subunit ChlD
MLKQSKQALSFCRCIFLSAILTANILCSAVVMPTGSESSSNFTYHSSVSEVRLVLFARDEHDRPVSNLQAGDFAVIDDERVIRNFRSFTQPDESKLDVFILLDFSESTVPQFQKEMAQVRQLVSEWPWNPGDRLSVVSFAGMKPSFICSEDCRTSLAGQNFPLAHGRATPLFDAVFLAGHTLTQRSQPDIWPLIILFSDGGDNISQRSFRDALDSVLQSGAQVYAVDTGNPERPSPGSSILQRLADDSGGQRLSLGEDPAEVLEEILNDLHSARVVTYTLPASMKEFHTVQILPTRNLKLQFRCRGGYYQHRFGAN